MSVCSASENWLFTLWWVAFYFVLPSAWRALFETARKRPKQFSQRVDLGLRRRFRNLNVTIPWRGDLSDDPTGLFNFVVLLRILFNNVYRLCKVVPSPKKRLLNMHHLQGTASTLPVGPFINSRIAWVFQNRIILMDTFYRSIITAS